MDTSLKRVGNNKFNAMLVASGSTGKSDSPTLLLHFVEENTASTVFVASDAAHEQFAQLELWRIYDMEVSGKCVKRARVPSRVGVRGLYEVVLKFPLKQLSLSKRAWPFDYGYKFIPWGSLNQQEDDSFVDVAGVVVGTPEKDVLVSLPKLRVTLSSESHIQEVELLGKHASTVIRAGDRVAFGGLRVQEYRGERMLVTGFLTIIEVNPPARESLPEFTVVEDTSRLQKAFKVTACASISVQEASRICDRALTDAQQGKTLSAVEFAVSGTFVPLTEKFFEDDVPIVGKEGHEKICWQTSIGDASGMMPVKVWTKAATVVLGQSACALQALWEKGNTEPDTQTELLDELNASLEKAFDCACSVSVRSYGYKVVKWEAQVNVNRAAIKE